ncbi:MAG: ABC transporter permease [Lachnospiraceae bacterium]|nr:ABC transporter permease [Lachnospiraceae bacterium]
MNLFQLSIRSVIRKPVKSILLFLIVLISAGFIYAGWACQNASVQTQNSSKQAVGASFRLEENEANRHERIEALSKEIGVNESGNAGGYSQKQLPTGEWITWTDNSFETLLREDIEKLSKVEGISDYNITTANTVVNPVNFERIEDKDVDQSNDQLGVSLRGNYNMQYDFDVQKGNIVIEDGRIITPGDQNVCVISRELANLNQLQVGGELQFNNWEDRENSEIYSATIVGIYDTIQKITPIMTGDSYRWENIIFTDLDFPEKAEGNEGNPLYQYATFWVRDVNEYETVKDRMKKADITWERYDFLDNTGMSDTMAENFNDLSQMSILMLALVMVSSVLILLFVFLFWLKNRVHEIGILLSVGRTKTKILMQLLIEGLLIGALSFGIATIAAPTVSKGVANYLVGYQMQIEEEKTAADEGMVSSTVNDGETEIVEVKIHVDGKIVASTAVSVLGIIIISILGSGIYVVVQKPKDILRQMNDLSES